MIVCIHLWVVLGTRDPLRDPRLGFRILGWVDVGLMVLGFHLWAAHFNSFHDEGLGFRV
jgi:hypothetical protein